MAQQVVVVGNGMVGARFAEELDRRDGQGRFAITVLGAEEHQPYNRVLLSDFLAGKINAAALRLPTPDPGARRTTIRRGAEVVRIDRAARQVHLHDGSAHPYDILVLATGARARTLPLQGLGGGLPPGVHALRTLDDAREIVAATINARHAIVIGAGVLGLEAATGLAKRGLAVTLVHADDVVMNRQLDAASSAIVVSALAKAGVSTILSADSHAVVLQRGRIAGLRLSDGRTLPAELLVMACGTVPETALAEHAGLPCDRGVLVGPSLASPADDRIFAIGDCAAPPEGGTGLIAQGWDQARTLAAALSLGTTPAQADPPAVPTDVVRVKGVGLDIVSMGASSAHLPQAPGHRVIRLADAEADRFLEVVVSDGRLAGATCVGAGPVAADLIATYTRGTAVPTDPVQLLIRPSLAAAPQTGSPNTMPDRFTVCRCNGVTKRDIRMCFSEGGRTMAEVAAKTRATTGCGGCTEVVGGLLEWLVSAEPTPADDAATPRSQPPRNKGGSDVPDAKHQQYGLETSAR